MRECATRELCKTFRLAVNDCGKEYGQFYRVSFVLYFELIEIRPIHGGFLGETFPKPNL